MKWFQVKEQSAGVKRLILSKYLYKIFGKNVLYIIAFLVSFFTFVFSFEIRSYSKKYFEVSYPYLNIKPSLINQFRHIFEYANSLADKFLVFCGDFKTENIVFENEDEKNQLVNDINSQKGVFLICSHIGNIDVFRHYALKYIKNSEFCVNIFISRKQSRIFNDFLKSVKADSPIKVFPVENIGINTGVELKENLDKGDIVFIAGDRLSQNNDTKFREEKMFGYKIFLPKGTFKLAKLMEVPVYFISAVKCNGKYRIILERQGDLKESALANSFVKFMERALKINPFQFFNFYDFFN